jgi:uncharacterized protein (DUF58 family)
MASRSGRFLLLLLLIVSLLARHPLILLIDALVGLVLGASWLWGRYCLAGVSYARRFGSVRLFCGEETDLWIEIANAKPLPLAWLKATDDLPAELNLRNLDLEYSHHLRRRRLTNTLSMRWYELVRRHYRLTCRQRGAFEIGPVVLSSGDIFGFRTRYLDLDNRQTVLVYPKLIPVQGLDLQPASPFGEQRANRRITDDPLRLAGARDYHPGDSVRHIHWKATARRGALHTKVFEPSASQALLIFLNSQTLGRAHEGFVVDSFETAAVVAASLAQATLQSLHPVGLFTNGTVAEAPRRVRVPASRHNAQLTAILETLARLTYFTFLSFDSLLRIELPRLPYGANVIAVTAILSEPILSALLDVRAAGHPVALVLVGNPVTPDLPPDLPTYFVGKDWSEIDRLELEPALPETIHNA